MEILSKDSTPKRTGNPVVLKILDPIALNERGPEALNEEIASFFSRWEATHVISAPSYIIADGGKERILLQGVDRVLWMAQNEMQGVAQARMQVAGQAAMEELSSGKVHLVGMGAVPPPPARPQGMKGGFAR
jgi:hypothetical protein